MLAFVRLNKTHKIGDDAMEESSVLSLWRKGLKHADISPGEVLEAQEKYRGESDYEILRRLYEYRTQNSKDNYQTLALLIDLKRIYLWEHNEQKATEVQSEIDEYGKRLDGDFQKRYNSINRDEILGLSAAERQELRDKALSELDDSWEKELDEYYRKQAGGD